VAALTKGVLHTMLLTKLKIATAALLAVAILGTGAGSVAHWALADAADGREDRAQRGAAERDAGGGREEAKALVAGKVVAVANDGKSFTLEVAGRGRGDDAVEAKKIEVKLGDKT